MLLQLHAFWGNLSFPNSEVHSCWFSSDSAVGWCPPVPSFLFQHFPLIEAEYFFERMMILGYNLPPICLSAASVTLDRGRAGSQPMKWNWSQSPGSQETYRTRVYQGGVQKPLWVMDCSGLYKITIDINRMMLDRMTWDIRTLHSEKRKPFSEGVPKGSLQHKIWLIFNYIVREKNDILCFLEGLDSTVREISVK